MVAGVQPMSKIPLCNKTIHIDLAQLKRAIAVKL